MAKTRNRHLIRGGKRLLAKFEKHEATHPGFAPYKSVVQEFLANVKAGRKESPPAPLAAPAEAEPE